MEDWHIYYPDPGWWWKWVFAGVIFLVAGFIWYDLFRAMAE